MCSGSYSRTVGGDEDEERGEGSDVSHNTRLSSVLLPGVTVMSELAAEEEKADMARKNYESIRVPLRER